MDGERWLLLNASPDLPQQIIAQPALHPRGLRHSPIEAVLLTDGAVEHVAGLLAMRERTPFCLYATPEIHALMRGNDMFGLLDPELVPRREVALGSTFRPLPGLSVTLFPVPGKAIAWREKAAPDARDEGEQTVGVALRAGGSRAFYIPGCAAITPATAARLRGAPLVLFDGTIWRDDGMRAADCAEKGHMAMDGPEGSITAFEALGVDRKVFIHVNNTNPVLDPASPERRAAEAAGWIIGQDGMEFRL